MAGFRMMFKAEDRPFSFGDLLRRPWQTLATVLKANPYHDQAGKFTTRDKAFFVSVGGVFTRSNERDRKLYASEQAKLKFTEYNPMDWKDELPRTLHATQNVKDKLTPSERSAIRAYTASGYGPINQALRYPIEDAAPGYQRQMAEEKFDSNRLKINRMATVIEKLPPIGMDLMTFRGIKEYSRQGKAIRKAFDDGTLIGSGFEDLGFGSVSIKRNTGISFSGGATYGKDKPTEMTPGVLFEIKTPRTTKGVFIGDNDHIGSSGDEGEFILQRGSRLVIEGARKNSAGGLIVSAIVETPSEAPKPFAPRKSAAQSKATVLAAMEKEAKDVKALYPNAVPKAGKWVDSATGEVLMTMTGFKSEGLATIMKANPYRDEDGQFTTKEKARNFDNGDKDKWFDGDKRRLASSSDKHDIWNSPLLDVPDRTDSPYVAMTPGMALERGQAPVKKVPVDDLISGQTTVEAQRLKSWDSGKEVEPIVVVQYKGSLYVTEGNHRAASAWSAGVKELPAHFTDLDDPKNKKFLKPKFRAKKADFSLILKANPYKDAEGKFTTKDRAVSVQSIARGKDVSMAKHYQKYDDPDVTVDSILDDLTREEREEIDQAIDKAQKAPSSQSVYYKDGKYTPERQAMHQEIFDSIFTPEVLDRATIKAGEKGSFVVLGGRGGSGKSSFTNGKIKEFDADKHLVLDSDAIKERLRPPYEGWNAYSVHDESSVLFDAFTEKAIEMGLNVVHDVTMRSHSVKGSVDKFKSAGYEVEGHYMFVPRQVSAKRAVSRYLGKSKGKRGRLVPVDVILDNKNNEENFDALKSSLDRWSAYDNQGAEPKLLGRGKK